MEKLLGILKNLHSDVAWANETALIDDGLLDSFDIIALVGDLNDTFGVCVELEHLEPDNFNSVDAIAALLRSLGAEI
ncbi:MAG: acyl carrier protein [Oscillospiraceae bacterium]|nr:acyl carrier protein [Oscillospiraceae bacterium]